MATIRTKFRSSSAEGREGALYYQVIHNRVVRQISTGYKLFASEWDQRSEAGHFPVNTLQGWNGTIIFYR